MGVQPRWDDPIWEQGAASEAALESPDGLIHAGLSTDFLTLCERMGDRELTGPDDYVRLNLDAPGVGRLHHTVSCPDCVAAMHA